jgi:hypothetical protein
MSNECGCFRTLTLLPLVDALLTKCAYQLRRSRRVWVISLWRGTPRRA